MKLIAFGHALRDTRLPAAMIRRRCFVRRDDLRLAIAPAEPGFNSLPARTDAARMQYGYVVEVTIQRPAEALSLRDISGSSVPSAVHSRPAASSNADSNRSSTTALNTRLPIPEKPSAAAVALAKMYPPAQRSITRCPSSRWNRSVLREIDRMRVAAHKMCLFAHANLAGISGAKWPGVTAGTCTVDGCSSTPT